MLTTSSELAQNKSSLQIKQDDKFFARLLSKENSVANSSFRVYYGGVSGSVPFMWESQPGTPKYTFSDTSLPPLTPPPPYFSKSNSKPIKKHSRSTSLLHALFPKMITMKKTNNVLPTSPSPSSSSSFSSLWSSSPLFQAMSPRKYERRSRLSTPGSSFDFRADDEEIAAVGSPTSTLCFNFRRKSFGKFRGCYGW